MARRPPKRRPRRPARRRFPRFPALEQRHLDVIGLALVALAAFLACVFYLGWAGGELGEALAGALVYLGGRVAYTAPVGVFAVGAVFVLRPMLPTTRPLKAGALCVIAALLLGVGLMIPFEATITRVLGVGFLFAFIVGGLFVIAEPGFLADEDE